MRASVARGSMAVLIAAAAVTVCVSCGNSSAAPDPIPRIATVTYERSAGPLGDSSNGERVQNDPRRIAELVELLGRYDTLDTPARPDSTVACVWATLTTVRYVTVDGVAHELRASSCDPTPFEADLGALVGAWLTDPPR